ncbi:unnamed protein product [Peniophora sp. CBMAI 1063]|nr:unnamed protein product [Peniophora sp. CBMAI 1063]
MASVSQTYTPHQLIARTEKDALIKEFVGKGLNELRTPALVIDRGVFASNCARMHEKAREWGAGFRAHLKTHKTAEGTRLQLTSSADATHAVVVSTLMEAWQVVNAGLVSEGIVKDILYGLPMAINKIADLSALWEAISTHGAIVRLMIDNLAQVEALEAFESARLNKRKWSVFIKCDGGQSRAGVIPGSRDFESLVKGVLASPATEIFGFYAHAGNAYASTSSDEAAQFLSSEVETVNKAAELAKNLLTDEQPPFVLSVGSTPTAHAASAETRHRLRELLHGTLELHAGNYPMLDLQQLSTHLIQREQIAQKLLATVISFYPGRGGADEAMCDAGGVALSKDTGPAPGYGDVIGKAWRIGRTSQEHGILVRTEGDGDSSLRIGEVIEVIGQHACYITAAYPWYYITDGGREVVDVWVPWKGW